MKKLATELKKGDIIKYGNVWGIVIKKRTTHENGKDISNDWKEVLFDVEIVPSVIKRRSKIMPIKQTIVEKQKSIFYFRKTTMVSCK